MTVLVGGMRVLNANTDQAAHGVFTDKAETLSTDVNLLDMGTEWKPASASRTCSRAATVTPAVEWTGTRDDLVFGSNSQLRALSEVYAGAGGRRVRCDFVAAWSRSWIWTGSTSPDARRPKHRTALRSARGAVFRPDASPRISPSMRPHSAVLDTQPRIAGIHPAPLGGTGLQFQKRVALRDGDKRRGVVQFGVNAGRTRRNKRQPPATPPNDASILSCRHGRQPCARHRTRPRREAAGLPCGSATAPDIRCRAGAHVDVIRFQGHEPRHGQPAPRTVSQFRGSSAARATGHRPEGPAGQRQGHIMVRKIFIALLFWYCRPEI